MRSTFSKSPLNVSFFCRSCCSLLQLSAVRTVCCRCSGSYWRISLTVSCSDLSWDQAQGSMWCTSLRKCPLSHGSHQTSRRKHKTGTVHRLFSLLLCNYKWHYEAYITELSGFVMWRLCCSIRAYIGATKTKTALEPVYLDASEPWEKWAGLPQSSCDIIMAINLLQYSPFGTAEVWRQYT